MIHLGLVHLACWRCLPPFSPDLLIRLYMLAARLIPIFCYRVAGGRRTMRDERSGGHPTLPNLLLCQPFDPAGHWLRAKQSALRTLVVDSIFVHSAFRRLCGCKTTDGVRTTFWCKLHSVRHLIRASSRLVRFVHKPMRTHRLSSFTLLTVPFKLVQCALTQNTDFCFALNIKFIKTFLFIFRLLGARSVSNGFKWSPSDSCVCVCVCRQYWDLSVLPIFHRTFTELPLGLNRGYHGGSTSSSIWEIVASV